MSRTRRYVTRLTAVALLVVVGAAAGLQAPRSAPVAACIGPACPAPFIAVHR